MRLALTVYEPPDFVRKQVDEVLEKYDACLQEKEEHEKDNGREDKNVKNGKFLEMQVRVRLIGVCP